MAEQDLTIESSEQIHNPQSAIHNPQSAIRNPQSEIRDDVYPGSDGRKIGVC
jgi:hypothetical protein